MKEIFLEQIFIKTLLPERDDLSNKGSFGNVLNIAGSKNYKGAALFSTITSLKVGAGYVCLASIKEVIDIVSKSCSEAVLYPLKEKNGTIDKNEYKKLAEYSNKYKVISLGCGLSSIDEKQQNIEQFVVNFLSKIRDRKNPLIIDADGLNIIAKKEITNLPTNIILTPHPMELSRLLKVDIKEILNDKKKYAKICAEKYNATIILKGANTITTDGTNIFISPFQNSALAKAGTGDVLTGIISGLLAQNMTPINASILGVYLHALSGELASKELTKYSVLASDVINYISNAIKEIEKQ